MAKALLVNIQFRPVPGALIGCLVTDEFGKQQDYVNVPGIVLPDEWIEEVRAAVESQLNTDPVGRYPDYKGQSIPTSLPNQDPDPVIPRPATPMRRSSTDDSLEVPTAQS